MKKPTERFPTYVCQSGADLLLCTLDVGNMLKQTYAVCVPFFCVMYDGRKKNHETSHGTKNIRNCLARFPLLSFILKPTTRKCVGQPPSQFRGDRGTPRHIPQNKRAKQRAVKSATTKKQMTTLPKTKELPNALFPLISFQSTSWPQIQDELLYCPRMHAVSEYSLPQSPKKSGIKKTEAKNITGKQKVFSLCKGY